MIITASAPIQQKKGKDEFRVGEVKGSMFVRMYLFLGKIICT